MTNVDGADAMDRNPFGREAMEFAARRLSTPEEFEDAAAPAAALAADGFAILPGLLDAGTLATVRDAYDQVNADTPPSRSSFGGYNTRRTFNLLGRTRAFDELIAHPAVIATIERHLDDQIQLSEVSSIILGPGEKAQILHHDDGCYPLPRPHEPLMVSVMWALDDFHEENGGTRVARGSHLVAEPDLDTLATEPIEMPAGSVVLWDGRLIHGGGANDTDADRRAIAGLYARAWLRQQENQYLALDHATVATFDRRYQRLLGWSLYGPHTGIVDGRDPKHLLAGLSRGDDTSGTPR